MNGVHDMGGMHGFGPVIPEPNEPVFHADWEARVLAMRVMMGAWRRWNIDAGRLSIEQMRPDRYLALSYYEKWFESLVTLSLNAGLITPEELARGQKADDAPVVAPAVPAERAAAVLAAGGPTLRDATAAPRFAVGDWVRARNINPEGHTRLPRYARGHRGVIELLHGAHVFPDSNARFAGEAPQPLYTVRFSARELWGADAPAADEVCLDLWESYLEPV